MVQVPEGPLCDALCAAAHQAYDLLSSVLDSSESDLVAMTFEREDTACVWVGDGFAPAANVALSEGEVGFKPYLHVVPEDFRQYNRCVGWCADGWASGSCRLVEVSLT